MTTHTTHGWSTTKTPAGYVARVVETTGWGAEMRRVMLQQATFPTRARAEGFAKKWVLYYRRQRDAV